MPLLGHHLERDALPAVGVERRGEADRVRLVLRVKVEGAPARPALHGTSVRLPHSFWRGKCGQAARGQALDQVQADAAHRDLAAGGCPTCRRAPAPCRPRPGRRGGCSARAASSRRRCVPRRVRPTGRPARRRPPPRRPRATTAHVATPGSVADRGECMLMVMSLAGMRAFSACFGLPADDRSARAATTTRKKAPDRPRSSTIAAYSSAESKL